jgi:hypothetical protein
VEGLTYSVGQNGPDGLSFAVDDDDDVKIDFHFLEKFNHRFEL